MGNFLIDETNKIWVLFESAADWHVIPQKLIFGVATGAGAQDENVTKNARGPCKLKNVFVLHLSLMLKQLGKAVTLYCIITFFWKYLLNNMNGNHSKTNQHDFKKEKETSLI